MRRLVMGLAGIVMAGSLSLIPSAAHAETTICTAESIDDLLECEPGWAVNINFMHWRMYRGHNCTNYVAWRLTVDGATEPDYLLGNAENWADRAEDHGVPVNSTPAPGAVGSWPGRNHLVYVEKVGNGWLQLAEDSWSQKRFRRYIANRGDSGYPAEFIHFPGAIRGGTPTVTGTAMVGHVLRANAGAWTPSGVRLSYTWLRNGVVIGGATGTTYQLVQADATKRISVAVTGTYPGKATRTAISSPTNHVLAGTITRATPTVTGYPIVGKTLTAEPGPWRPSGLRFAYRWYADDEKISGATERTWTVGDKQVGKRITVRIAGGAAGYEPVRARSAPTLKVVKPGQPLGTVVAGKPQITAPRTMVVGDRLRVTPGEWSPAPVTLSVRWLRNNAVIPGETKRSYTLRPEDIGKRVHAEVTGTRPHFSAAKTRASAPDVVHPRKLRPSVTPTITGSGLVGEQLTVNPGDWIPGRATTSIQWTRDGEFIPGETGPTYQVDKDDLRHVIGAKLTTTLKGWPDDRRRLSSPAVIRAVPRIVTAVGPSDRPHAKRLTISVRALGKERPGSIELMQGKRVVKTVELSGDQPTMTNFVAEPGTYTLKLTYAGPAWLTSPTERVKVTIR